MTAAELVDLGDAADIEVHQAEQAGDVKRQIIALRDRSRLWASYRRHLMATGADWSGAAMACQRGQATSAWLEGGLRR